MNHVSSSPELARIEKKYENLCDDSSPMTVPIRTPQQRIAALRAHTARPCPIPPKTETHPPATHYLHDILSHENMHSEKGIRPSHIVCAERSLDQILEVTQTIAEIAIDSAQG